MYTKEHLVHEGVKVLKVSYYLIILLLIKTCLEMALSVAPTTTKTTTYDSNGKIQQIATAKTHIGNA